MRCKSYFAAVLLAVTASACSHHDPAAARDQYIKSGDQYFAKGQFGEAIVQYRNAIQQDAQSGVGRKKLAQAYAKTGDVGNAYREYIRAADLLPSDVDAQMSAGTLLLLAGQFEDAQSRADAALKLQPTKIEALILRANALAGLKRMDDALHDVEQAIRNEPDRGLPYTALAAIRSMRGDRGEAEAAFRKAIEIDPRSVEARLAFASFWWSASNVAETEAQLKAALEVDPHHPLANRALASLYITTGRAKDAEPFLKTAAESTTDASGRLALADYYARMNRPADAKAILEKLTGDPQAYVEAKTELARLALQENDRPAATRLVQEALAKQPGAIDALLLKGTLLAADGKLNDALAAVKNAAEGDPQSADAQFALGRIHRLRGDTDDAITAFNQALQLHPQLAPAELQLAELHLSAGRLTDADHFAQSALKKMPQSRDVQFVAARINLGLGNVAAAEPVLRKLAAEAPSSPLLQRELGLLELRKKNVAGARTAFENAVKSDAIDPDALAALVRLDLDAKNPDGARTRVDAAVEKSPRNAPVLIVAAQAYATLKDFDKAERLLRKAIEIDPSRNEPFGILGQMYLRQGRSEQALKEFQSLATHDPKSVGAHTFIGTIYQATNKRAEAKEAYRRALAIDPRAPVAANNLAWLYVEDNENLDDALQLAQVARNRWPTSGDVADTLGWIYYKKGLLASAIDSLKDAVAKQPKNADAQYHLGLAFAKNGDTKQARQTLEAALQIGPQSRLAAEARETLKQMSALGS